MNAKTEMPSNTSALDAVKLILSAALLVGGIVGYYWFPEASVVLRALGVVLSLALAIVVFLTTERGREVWRFIQSSRVELRKVIWPTRPETFQTTVAVIVLQQTLVVEHERALQRAAVADEGQHQTQQQQ